MTLPRLRFCCDTPAQADALIAERAGRLLPELRRISLERAQAGVWGML
jgi:hypothetical protein